MKPGIFIVSGSKGGTGKSIVTMSLIDYLTEPQEKKVFLVESDTSNPDVGRIYLKSVDGVPRLPGAAFDLDETEGWINFINAAEEYPDHYIVVNSAARSDKGFSVNGALLSGSLSVLEREVETFWVINHERDSLELCKKYMETAPGILHIVKNGYFGKNEEFELYNNSKLKTAVEAQGKSLYFTELDDTITSHLRNNNIPIADAINDKSIFRGGSRTALAMWRERCRLMFNEVIA